MTLNVGMSPKSMGLIYLADTKDIVKPDRMSERWGVVEQSTEDVYGSRFSTSIAHYQYFTVPLKYQGGLLVMGVTPEIGYATSVTNLTPIQTLKDFIEYDGGRNTKDKTYVGEVPEEIDWFYVKDIEVYIKGTDTTPLANDAIINVRNHVAVTQRYVSGLTSPQTYGFKMTGTIDSNGTTAMYYNRDEQALPLQAGTKEVHLSTDIRNMSYPNKLYSNYQHITSAGSEDRKGPSIIMGLLDESHPKDYDSRIRRQVSAYNYPDRELNSVARTIRDTYYTGNKPITFSVLGPYGNSTYFSSQKLDTLTPANLTSNMSDVNTLNVNTILEQSTGDNYYSSHGVNRFYYGGPFASALPIRTPIVMSLPTINTPLSIYNNAYPKLSTVTPVNLGKQFEDVDLGLYQFMIDNSAYSQLMNLVRSLLNESIDPTNAVPGQFVTKLVLTGTDIVMMMIGRQAMMSDLNNSFNSTLRVADVTSLGILSDVVETWNLHLPQTETIEINDEFKKNKGNPFIKVPINRLFKSVGEFYDYVESLNITSFQNVNVTPYIDSEYNQVWEKWGKQLFKRGSSEYRGTSNASFKRPNDTNIDYK